MATRQTVTFDIIETSKGTVIVPKGMKIPTCQFCLEVMVTKVVDQACQIHGSAVPEVQSREPAKKELPLPEVQSREPDKKECLPLPEESPPISNLKVPVPVVQKIVQEVPHRKEARQSEPVSTQVYAYRDGLYPSLMERRRAHLQDLYQVSGVPQTYIDRVLDLTVQSLDCLTQPIQPIEAFKTLDGLYYGSLADANLHISALKTKSSPDAIRLNVKS